MKNKGFAIRKSNMKENTEVGQNKQELKYIRHSSFSKLKDLRICR